MDGFELAALSFMTLMMVLWVIYVIQAFGKIILGIYMLIKETPKNRTAKIIGWVLIIKGAIEAVSLLRFLSNYQELSRLSM